MANDLPLAKRSIEVLGSRMAFHEQGQGTPILFLHGNPTSSYLWRKVMGGMEGCGRLIAPDLIGMGDSAKLPDPGPEAYSFDNHRRHLFGLFDALLGPDEPVVLVLHDWGSALGFEWARTHPDRVLAIAYMEAIVHPIPDWSEWTPAYAPVFQGFRSDKGEAMILDDNMFVERVLLGSNLQRLSDTAAAEYRRPYLNREDRWPTLAWPRQLPIAGEPPEIVELVERYGRWMAGNAIPKLFVNAEPGALLKGRVREFCRTWLNQVEVTVPGVHFVQEDSGDEIGRHIATWLRERVL
jgi:haloalkane dehalogenase